MFPKGTATKWILSAIVLILVVLPYLGFEIKALRLELKWAALIVAAYCFLYSIYTTTRFLDILGERRPRFGGEVLRGPIGWHVYIWLPVVRFVYALASLATFIFYFSLVTGFQFPLPKGISDDPFSYLAVAATYAAYELLGLFWAEVADRYSILDSYRFGVDAHFGTGQLAVLATTALFVSLLPIRFVAEYVAAVFGSLVQILPRRGALGSMSPNENDVLSEIAADFTPSQRPDATSPDTIGRPLETGLPANPTEAPDFPLKSPEIPLVPATEDLNRIEIEPINMS